MGHVLCSCNHKTTHSPWNQCLQGNTVTSSPRRISSIQIVHSAFPLSPIISLSNFFFASFWIASSVAGGAALDVGLASISWLMIRSRASCE